MPLNPTITYLKSDGPMIRVGFKLAPSGSYVTGGDALNLAIAPADPLFVGSVPAIESLGAPINLDVWDQSGNIANGVFPVTGANQTALKVKFTSAFNTELAASGYPGSITGGNLVGEAVFNKL